MMPFSSSVRRSLLLESPESLNQKRMTSYYEDLSHMPMIQNDMNTRSSVHMMSRGTPNPTMSDLRSKRHTTYIPPMSRSEPELRKVDIQKKVTEEAPILSETKKRIKRRSMKTKKDTSKDNKSSRRLSVKPVDKTSKEEKKARRMTMLPEMEKTKIKKEKKKSKERSKSKDERKEKNKEKNKEKSNEKNKEKNKEKRKSKSESKDKLSKEEKKARRRTMLPEMEKTKDKKLKVHRNRNTKRSEKDAEDSNKKSRQKSERGQSFKENRKSVHIVSTVSDSPPILRSPSGDNMTELLQNNANVNTIGSLSPLPDYHHTVSFNSSEDSYPSSPAGYFMDYPSTSDNVIEETVDIDLICTVMCRFIKEAIDKGLGLPFSDFRPLFHVTKDLSNALKKTYTAVEASADIFDENRRVSLLMINERLKTDIVKGLFKAIKSIQDPSHNLVPLSEVSKSLSSLVFDLYNCIEEVTFDQLLLTLQAATLQMKDIVRNGKKMTQEEFNLATANTLICSLELIHFVQTYVFIRANTKTFKRTLLESCFSYWQSMRSLLIQLQQHRTDPGESILSPQATTTLKKVADLIRTISKIIKEEENVTHQPYSVEFIDKDYKPYGVDEISILFIRATSLIANARSKYMTKSRNMLARDEKDFMESVSMLTQVLNHLGTALISKHFEPLIASIQQIDEHLKEISQIIFPIIDTAIDDNTSQELVHAMDNTIRCMIQLKILAAKIATNPSSIDFHEDFAHIVLLFGVYISLLVDTSWKLVHPHL